MPHVHSAKGQGHLVVDGGVDVFENSYVNIDTTGPIAAALIAQGKLVVSSAVPAPVSQVPETNVEAVADTAIAVPAQAAAGNWYDVPGCDRTITIDGSQPLRVEAYANFMKSSAAGSISVARILNVTTGAQVAACTGYANAVNQEIPVAMVRPKLRLPAGTYRFKLQIQTQLAGVPSLDAAIGNPAALIISCPSGATQGPSGHVRNNTEPITAIIPRGHVVDGTRRGALWAHASGGDHTEAWLSAPARAMIDACKLPVLAGQQGGPKTWGNDAAQTKITDALAFLANAEFNAKNDKVILFGVSMGGLAMLNWARNNPTKVAAIVLMYAATDLQWVHDNGAAVDTEAAYGGSLANFNAAVAAHNPDQNRGSYAQFPIQFWRSDADNTVSSARQSAFIQAVGNIEEHVLAGAAHADLSVIDPVAVAQFVKAHA